MKNLIFFLSVIFFVSCSKETASPTLNSAAHPGFTVHTIKAGEHYAETNRFQVFGRSQLRFTVIFDSTAIYTTKLPENRLDINKLYGFSDCATQHHANSARFGWRWNGKSVDILAYTYIAGKRQSKLLGTSEIGKEHNYSLTLNKNEYLFEFGENKFSMPRFCDTETASGYLLYPYFGGDEPAPHDVNILIKEIAEEKS